MPKISASIISWNEEDNIDLALRSIKGFADEVVIFDNNSWDHTVKKAREWIRKLNLSGQVIVGKATSCAECRRRSISKCTGDWILLQDANVVFKHETVKRLRRIVNNHPKKPLVIGVSSFNLLGDYSHFMNRRMWNSAHRTLYKAGLPLDFSKVIDRPVFRRYTFMELKHPKVANLSRVRPAWRCWYRGEPFMRSRAWNSPNNRQYHWCRVKKYPSIARFIEKTQGLSVKRVKALAPSWYLKLLQKEARPLPNLNFLPEVLRAELKKPRFKLIYKNGRIVGRKPSL